MNKTTISEATAKFPALNQSKMNKLKSNVFSSVEIIIK